MSLLVSGFLLLVLDLILIMTYNVRFKSMFSNEKVIKETREAVNSLLLNVNDNADRNLSLLEDRIKQVKALSAETDRKILAFKKDMEQLEAEYRKLKSERDYLEVLQKQASSSPIQKNELPPVKKSKKNPYSDLQGDLFFTDKGVEELGLKDKIETPAFTQIPVIEPVALVPEEAADPQKDFKTRVKDLKALGYTADFIAQDTGRSIQEVNLVLQFV